MQYAFFEEKDIGYACYNGVWGKAPEAVEFSRIFALNVTVCKVTFKCTLQKEIGEQDVLHVVAPQYFCWGSNSPPVPAPIVTWLQYSHNCKSPACHLQEYCSQVTL